MTIIFKATEISGLSDPTYNSGAASKKYVDSNDITYWSSQTDESAGSIYYDGGKVVVAPSGTDYGAYRFQVSGNSYFSGSVLFRGTGISGIADPTYASGVANKHYVDTISSNAIAKYLHSGVTLNAVSANTLATAEYIRHIGSPTQYIQFETDGTDWTTLIVASGDKSAIRIVGGETPAFAADLNSGYDSLTLLENAFFLQLDDDLKIMADADSVKIAGDGNDVDFITHNSSDNEVIHSDGETGFVGIGQATPAYKLHVDGAISAQAFSGSNLRIGTETTITNIDTDTNLASDSDNVLATQKAVKAYVDDISGSIVTWATVTFPASANYLTEDEADAIYAPSSSALNYISGADDTNIASPVSGHILMWDGGDWENKMPSMTFNVANIRLSSQQNINVTRFTCPASKKVYIWQACACNSGGASVGDLYIECLSGTTSVYKTSSSTLQEGNPLGVSNGGNTEIRFMYSGGNASGIEYGTGFMNISVY